MKDHDLMERLQEIRGRYVFGGIDPLLRPTMTFLLDAVEFLLEKEAVTPQPAATPQPEAESCKVATPQPAAEPCDEFVDCDGTVERPIPRAYLLLCIDISVPGVQGIELCSESNPTTHLQRYRHFTICEGYGADYEEGIRDLRSKLCPGGLDIDGNPGPSAVNEFYAWVFPLLSPRARSALRF